jgi:exopolysaccharide biosynthesis polyprenyl glycosylphosphotransferase
MYGLPALAFGISLLVWIANGRFEAISSSYSSYLDILFILQLVWIGAANNFKLTDVEFLLQERFALGQVLLSCGVSYLFLFAALFFLFHRASFSRMFILFSAAMLALLAFGTRMQIRFSLNRRAARRMPVRVLMIGADRFARRAAHRLMRSAPWCRVVGYVRIPGQPELSLNAPVYALESLAAAGLGRTVDDVIIAVLPQRFGDLPQLVAAVECIPVPVRAIVDVTGRLMTRDRVVQMGRLNLLELGGSLHSFDYLLSKRIFDVVASVCVLIISAPLMMVIAALVKLSSSGPILFAQERVGMNGKIFTMYKFRTMRVSTAEESDTRWTVQNDPRRTRVGMFLRRSSLDEMPQFFNVLKGDMSVVGPRPERPYYVRRFVHEISRYNARHRLNAGITGWAQVNGLRGDTSIRKRVAYDLYYLNNWSLLLDFRIVLMTIRSGLFGSTAY